MDKFEKQKAEQEKEAAEKAAAEEEAAKMKAAKEEDGGISAAMHEKGGSEEKSPIEEAKHVLTKLTKTLEEAKKFAYETMLSRKTPAGQKEISQEEREVEDARNLIKGSGFEDK